MADLTNFIDSIVSNYGTGNAYNGLDPAAYSRFLNPQPTITTTIPQTQTAVDPMTGRLIGLQSGMTAQDLGNGTYNILDAAGNNLGLGYKDPSSALYEIARHNLVGQDVNTDGTWTNPNLLDPTKYVTDQSGNKYNSEELQKYWNYLNNQGSEGFLGNNESIYRNQDGIPTQDQVGNPFQETRKFSSQADLDAQLAGLVSPKNYNGVMGDWEALGQILGGGNLPDIQDWGNLPTNQRDELVSGLNTLYGSQPVFTRDASGNYKLSGYDLNLAPNTAQDWTNGTDKADQETYGTFLSHNGKSQQWSNNVWRELQNPDAWKSMVTPLGNNQVYVTADQVANLPGWLNRDSYKHDDIKHGILSDFWDAEGNVLQYADPGLYDLTRNQIGKDTMMSIAQPVGDAIGIYFTGVPIGSLATAADSASRGDESGMWKRLGSAALSYFGGQMDPNTGVLGSTVSTGSPVLNSAVNSAVLNAGGAAISGGNVGEAALLGGLFGGMGGAGGSQALANYTGLDPTLANILYSGGSNALRQYFTTGEVDPRKVGISAGSAGLNSLFKG